MSRANMCVFEGANQTALGDPLQEAGWDFDGTSGESPVVAVVGSGPRKRYLVRFFADADCYVTWGLPVQDAQTDGTDGRPVAAETEEYFNLEVGHQFSVIART